MGFFDQLFAELSHMDLKNFIIVALLFYVPFHFSRKAETLFFHLLYSFLGIYLLLTMEDVRIIYDLKMEVGLGLLIPQIKFIMSFTQESIQTAKMMTTNTYYFFITLYYKILRVIHWIKATINNIKIFINTFSFDKEDYQSQKQSYSRQEEAKSSKSERNSYQGEAPKKEKKTNYGEFERFYSSNDYVVLDVSVDDDLQTIKKARNKLARKYHPDRNVKKLDTPEKVKQYTEIMAKISNAYDNLKRYHK